ncbi:MAG: hypothetical protein Q8S73_41875 [Deltaproteobacteria bacterium]|nr:hypothetical protein [Myxococcales bacterium]MDP3220710.1 hypothetical protein [Deltaproteobacteria bacterium]
MQTRSDSSPNSFPWLALRRATIDVLKTSFDFRKPGGLDALVRRVVETGDQQFRDIRSLLWGKL